MQTSGGIAEEIMSDDVTSTSAQGAHKRAYSAVISDAERHQSDPPMKVQRLAACLSQPVTNTGSALAAAVAQWVDGDVLDALGRGGVQCNGLWVSGFTKLSGSLIRLNPVRRTGHEWRSASLRVRGGSVRTKGVLSVWVNEDNTRCIVAHADADKVCEAVELWGVDSAVRNRIQHALNGNLRGYASDWERAHAHTVYSNHCHNRAQGYEYWMERMDGLQEDLPAAILAAHEMWPPGGPGTNMVLDRPQGPGGLIQRNQPDGPESQWAINNATRNRLMHALMGNQATRNYYSPIEGLSASSAAEAAEELADRADGFDGPGSESDEWERDSQFPGSEGESWEGRCGAFEEEGDWDDFDVSARKEYGLVDADTAAIIKGVGTLFVEAYCDFNEKFEPTSAGLWNINHDGIDSIKRHGLLCDGVRWKTKGQPGGKEASKGGKKRTGKRSKAMKARDGARLNDWLGKMNPVVAEGWVRANKPDPSAVPTTTKYMAAYSRRCSRNEFYGTMELQEDEVENARTIASEFDVWLRDAVAGECIAYLGPMSRELIQSLLAIGNIELHPGPVPGLNANNYDYDGAGLDCVARASSNYLLTLGVPGDLLSIGGNVNYSVHGLTPLAVAHCVAAGPGVESLSLQGIGGTYVAAIAWPDAKGSAYGGDYEMKYSPTVGWVTEYTAFDGSVHVFPDIQGVAASHTLIAKLTVRKADGSVDQSHPALCIYSNVPPVIPLRFADRRHNVVKSGVSVHYYRGCNNVVVVCPTMYGRTTVIPMPIWAECEKLFASPISRALATNNASQVLRTCPGMDGAMMGLTCLALGETMLAPAMVAAAVAGPHRDEALKRAKSGKGLRSRVSRMIWPDGGDPDYGSMIHGDTSIPWEVKLMLVFAFVLLLAGSVYFMLYLPAVRTVDHLTALKPHSIAWHLARAVPFARYPLLWRARMVERWTRWAGRFEGEFDYLDDLPLTTRAWRAVGRWAWRTGSAGAGEFPRSEPFVDPHHATEERLVAALESAARARLGWFVTGERNVHSVARGQMAQIALAVLRYTAMFRDLMTGAEKVRVSAEGILVWWVHICLLCPIYEEWGKRRWRAVWWGVPLFESVSMITSGVPFWFAFANRFLLHGGFAVLPYWIGVALHAVFNIVVVCSGGGAGLAGKWLVPAAAGSVVVAAMQGIEYVVEKGKVWWMTDPMGKESRFDELIGTDAIAATDPLLEINLKPRRPRYGKTTASRVYQLFPSIIDMASFAANRGNFCHSMHGRVGRLTPMITDLIGFASVRVVLTRLAGSVRARQGLIEPVAFADFVSKFGPAKRAQYEEAAELFSAVGCMPIMHPELYPHMKADRCAAFLKHELNVFRFDVDYGGCPPIKVAPADPRTICPRWLALQSQMIPYILAYDGALKEELRERSPELFGLNVRFASGLNVKDMSDMCSSLMADNGLDCVIVNGDDGMFTCNKEAYYVDGERWDAHFRQEYHHLILDCYEQMGLPRHLAEAMHKLVYRKLDYGQGVSCKINRNNASGESDTTLRNGKGNFAVILVALKQCGFLAGIRGVTFIATAKRLGFVYEVASAQLTVFDPYGDFCARVWLVRQMVLKPGRILAKGMWAANKSIPLEELRAAKLAAMSLDLAAFPEMAAALAPASAVCGPPKARAMAVVKAARYSDIGSYCDSELWERERFFALRYGVDYLAACAELGLWARAVVDDEWEVEFPLLRVIAEVDMGVTSSAVVSVVTGRKLVPHSSFASLSSARGRRMGVIGGQGRASWLAAIWNALMHAINGNRAVYFVATSVGWVGGGNFIIPEQTLSYQRQQQMKNNSQGGQQRKARGKSNNSNSKKGVTASKQNKASNEMRQLLNATAKSLNITKQRQVKIPRSVAGYSGLTEKWRRSLLDPFNTPGCVAAGDFYVRNSVPYTIKRNIQLSTTSSGNCTILCHPSLNCMMWNPDASVILTGPAGYSFFAEPVTAQSLANGSGVVPYPAAKLACGGTGLSLPQQSALFSRHRIVSWGVRVRFDGNFNTASGKVVCATLPYEGYLPAGGYNSTQPCCYIDTPYDNGLATYDTDQTVFSSHPGAAVSKRRFTPTALISDMGLPVNAQGILAPTIASSVVVGLPQTETFMITEISGKVFECQPRPCSAAVWEWRDAGLGSTAVAPGTTTETISLSAGNEVFPGCVLMYNQAGGPIGNMLLPGLSVDSSALQAKGFESVALCFEGLPLNSTIADIELVYNIEAVPSVTTGVAVPGCTPASASAIKRQPGESRAQAEEMLQNVSATGDKMIVSAGEALAGLARAAATSGVLGPAAQAAGFAIGQFGGGGRGGRSSRMIGMV